ncbi:MAG: phasin family protein [Alphaproteobacteria bacterium]
MNDTIQKNMASAANEAKAHFESFSKVFESFMGQDGANKAASAGAENLRAASEATHIVVEEVGQIASSMTQLISNSLNQAFETQAKMLASGGVQQALEIQYAYLNESMESGFSELSRVADRATVAMTKAGAPLQARFDEVSKSA